MAGMGTIFLLCVLFGAAMFWCLKRLTSSAPSAVSLPYRRARLFSAAERSFGGALEQAVGGRFRLLSKVRLADVLHTQPGLSASARATAFNRIAQKHADFVLCDPQTWEPVLVVELDDRSHARADRQQRDAFVDAALAAAGLPILRVSCQASYGLPELSARVAQALEGQATGERARQAA